MYSLNNGDFYCLRSLGTPGTVDNAIILYPFCYLEVLLEV